MKYNKNQLGKLTTITPQKKRQQKNQNTRLPRKWVGGQIIPYRCYVLAAWNAVAMPIK